MARTGDMSSTAFTWFAYILIFVTLCHAEAKASTNTETSENVIPSVELSKRDTGSATFLNPDLTKSEEVDTLREIQRDLSDFNIDEASRTKLIEMFN